MSPSSADRFVDEMAVLFTDITFRRFAMGKSESFASFASFAPHFLRMFFLHARSWQGHL